MYLVLVAGHLRRGHGGYGSPAVAKYSIRVHSTRPAREHFTETTATVDQFLSGNGTQPPKCVRRVQGPSAMTDPTAPTGYQSGQLDVGVGWALVGVGWVSVGVSCGRLGSVGVGWGSDGCCLPGSRAPVGTLGLTTRTNRAPTLEPAGRSKGLGTRYLVTFHGAVSSPLPVTPLYVGLGYIRFLLYLRVVK